MINDDLGNLKIDRMAWDEAIDVLFELIDEMADCEVQYCSGGLKRGVTVAFYHGNMDEWIEVRFFEDTDGEITGLVELVIQFLRAKKAPKRPHDLDSELFQAICTWIARKHMGVGEGDFQSSYGVLHPWESLRAPMLQVLKGDVPFPM